MLLFTPIFPDDTQQEGGADIERYPIGDLTMMRLTAIMILVLLSASPAVAQERTYWMAFILLAVYIQNTFGRFPRTIHPKKLPWNQPGKGVSSEEVSEMSATIRLTLRHTTLDALPY